MTSRRIRWLTYWNFAKLTKRWPRKPERRLINTIAEQAVAMIKEPMTFAGFPVKVDSSLQPGEWHVGYPETHTIGGTPREDINAGITQEEAEATLCGCGHGDYRTCPCEPEHPSKATGQFDHIDWPEDD